MNMPIAATKSLGAALEIDPRSFHVFELQGDRVLFDRATGTTSELSPIAFEVLHIIRKGATVAEATATVARQYEGIDPEDLVAALAELKAAGFFRFTPVKPATDEELSYLWQHKPRRLQLLMAEGCNLGCRYCYQWRNGTNQKGTLMPWNVAQAAVDYLLWRSGGRRDLQITFFGGEPLLNYTMIQRVVEYCKALEKSTNRTFIFELITNGTLLSKPVVDFLIEHKFLLFISLDGWREMHEYNRPALHGEDLYETIVRNAVYANQQYLKHKLPHVKVRANLTNRYHDRQKVGAFLESLGFKLIGVGAIEPLPHGNPSPAALTEDQMDEEAELSRQSMVASLEKVRAGERLSYLESRTFNSATAPLSKRSTLGVTCGVCRNTTVVDNRGNMYPCHRYGEMEAYRIGNVFTGLDRQLVLDYYRKINGHSTTECHDCWIRDYCGAGCAWLLSDKQGHIHHPTLRECTRRRKGMEDSLWLRKELRKSFPDWFKDQPGVDIWDWEEEIGNSADGEAGDIPDGHLVMSALGVRRVRHAPPRAQPPINGERRATVRQSISLPLVQLAPTYGESSAPAAPSSCCSETGQGEGCTSCHSGFEDSVLVPIAQGASTAAHGESATAGQATEHG